VIVAVLFVALVASPMSARRASESPA
jgi:hypothetical protein